MRAPCCEKMGLKKGPWTREEDQILIQYIRVYGHGNWRALPKQAGLLRCGKSCRLRWINYLRPDIKRGNFSKEEEDTIIKLHGLLGNRWSAIAARLPGRTDNEIKNVWHTHLKKKLKQVQPTTTSTTPETKQKLNQMPKLERIKEEEKDPNPAVNPITTIQTTSFEDQSFQPNSPQHSLSLSDISSVTSGGTITDNNNTCTKVDELDNFPEMDENFWSDVFSAENPGSDFPEVNCDPQLQFPSSPLHAMEYAYAYNSNVGDDTMDFWNDLFTRAGELQQF